MAGQVHRTFGLNVDMLWSKEKPNVSNSQCYFSTIKQSNFSRGWPQSDKD